MLAYIWPTNTVIEARRDADVVELVDTGDLKLGASKL
jgi:hypothetical protein